MRFTVLLLTVRGFQADGADLLQTNDERNAVVGDRGPNQVAVPETRLCGTADLIPRRSYPVTKGARPKGKEHDGTSTEILKSIYLREWKTDHLDLGILYRSPQLNLVIERYFAGEHDATEKAVLVLRHWFARYCGERVVQNALALGRGRDVRQAHLAAWLLVFRLEHPELTRKEEAAALEHEFGLAINTSAHCRAVETMFASTHRYGQTFSRILLRRVQQSRNNMSCSTLSRHLRHSRVRRAAMANSTSTLRNRSTDNRSKRNQ